MLDFICSKQFYLPIVYIVVGIVLYGVIASSINRVSKFKIKKNAKTDKKRITIISIVKNLIKYFIAIIVILAILSVYGVDTTSIIASL